MELMRDGVPAPGRAAGRDGGSRARRLVRAGALLAVGLVAGAAVPALANAALTPTTYFACVTTRTGSIKIVSKSAVCAAGQHKISWNNVGPRGARGLPGPAGVVTGYQDSTSNLTSNPVVLPAGPFTSVATLNVPAGNYIVNADVSVVNPVTNTTTNTVSCDLFDNTSDQLDAAVTLPVNFAGSIPLQLAGNFASKFTIDCWDQQGGTQVFATITAVPTNNNVQTTG